jgi:hypothetical protein
MDEINKLIDVKCPEKYKLCLYKLHESGLCDVKLLIDLAYKKRGNININDIFKKILNFGESNKLLKIKDTNKFFKIVKESNECKITECELNECELDECELNEGKLIECKLNECKLNECKLNECKLNEGKLNECNLNEGKLNEGKLNEGKLNEGKLNEGKLNECNLNEGKLNEGKLNKGKLSKGKLNDDKINKGKLNNDKINNDKINIECPPQYRSILRKLLERNMCDVGFLIKYAYKHQGNINAVIEDILYFKKPHELLQIKNKDTFLKIVLDCENEPELYELYKGGIIKHSHIKNILKKCRFKMIKSTDIKTKPYLFVSNIRDGIKISEYYKLDNIDDCLDFFIEHNSTMIKSNHYILNKTHEYNKYCFSINKELIENLNYLYYYEYTVDDLITRFNTKYRRISQYKICNYLIDIETNMMRMIRKHSTLSKNITIDINSFKDRHIYNPDCDRNFWLSDEQYKICIQILESRKPIICLHGKPGCGKTTMLKRILDELRGLNVLCGIFAISGKAVLNALNKACGKIWTDSSSNYNNKEVSNIDLLDDDMDICETNGDICKASVLCGTIAKYFTYNGFINKTSYEKIIPDVIIIDEASMLDYKIFNEILSTCLKYEIKLILVGDPNQLPPIGILGRPFVDILNKKIHSDNIEIFNVSQVYRQSINNNLDTKLKECLNEMYYHTFQSSKYHKIPDDVNKCSFNIIECENIMEEFMKIYNNQTSDDILILTAQKNQKNHKIHNIYDITNMYCRTQNAKKNKIFYRVGLSCVNVHTLSHEGVEFITEDFVHTNIQSYNYNVVYEELYMNDYVVGDKILRHKNEYLENDTQYNGDIYIIRDISDDRYELYNSRTDKPYEEDKTYVEDNFQSAYCVTVHKAQGSEAKIVIICIPNDHNHMWTHCGRAILYTSISRAKDKCYILINNIDNINKYYSHVNTPYISTFNYDDIHLDYHHN